MGRFLSALVFCTALLGCGSGSDQTSDAQMVTARASQVPAEIRDRLAKALFSVKPVATRGAAQAFGSYSKGCLAGGKQLAETGPTWQAMRLSRNRNWGHPDLVDFIQDLSRVAARQPGWKGLYVGDMSQPRGGPMRSGHRSHQMGLDVDIWMRPAVNLTLPAKAREHISSISMRRDRGAYVNGSWTPAHHEIIKAAASDPRVARIFVFAGAKVQMCDDEKGDKAWLRKVRPWWGHHYHFHVRLNCPEGDASCINQDEPPRGDGCQDARDWVADIINPPPPDPNRKPTPPRKELLMTDLPVQCLAVLQAQ